MRNSAIALVLAALTSFLSLPAAAVPFTDGQMYSFSQNTWGASPAVSPPAKLVQDHFDSLYPGGLIVGGTNYIQLTSAGPVLDYLPQTGPAAALNAILIDPTSSSSGIFGGQVTGLALNIAFSDAGYTLGSLGIPFGDLLFHDLTGNVAGLNGDNFRQFLDLTELALGGGNAGYSIADLSTLIMQVNGGFEGGFTSTYAQDHFALPAVQPSSVPEPSALLLFATALLLMECSRRRVRIDK